MKKNNYGLISILFTILILFSCEKDLYHDQIYQKNNNSRLLKGEEAKAVYDRLENLLNENSVYKKTTNNNGVIQYDEVLQVIDTLGNSKYTFEVNHPQSSEKKFFNLVYSEKNNQSKAKLVEYRMSNEFYNQYKSHRNFRLFAGEVHFTTLASKTPCPPDSDFWMQVLPPSSGSSGNWGNENPHSGVITPIPISDPFPDTPGGGSNPAGNDSSDNFDVEDPVYDFQTFYRINPSVIEPTTSPCGDDDNSGVIVPDDITSYLSLSAEQLNWWDNIADSSTKDSILTYLQENTLNGVVDPDANNLVSNLINLAIENNSSFVIADITNSLNFDNFQEFKDYCNNYNDTVASDFEIEDDLLQPSVKSARCKFKLVSFPPYYINVQVKQKLATNTNPYEILGVTSNQSGATLGTQWDQNDDFDISFSGDIATITLTGSISINCFIEGIGIIYTDQVSIVIKVNKNTGTFISGTLYGLDN